MHWGTFSKNVSFTTVTFFMSGDLTGLCLYMCSIIIHQSLFIWAATLLNTNQNSGDSAMGLTEKPLNGLIKATTTTKNKSHQFRNVY